MIILSIETSCDETAVSIVEVNGTFPHASYTIRGDALFSQVEIHREYGGVFPNVAKREHALTLIPMLEKALTQAKLKEAPHRGLFPEQKEQIHTLLEREHDLANALLKFFETYNTPVIDLIAVTSGPGLEPALWVGINFAKALSVMWDVPVVGINHMEGHIFSSVFDGRTIPDIAFPVLSLLISGGHTELVLMRNWGQYEVVGQTRDDAVGEAFDKVARMLDLPYPGGPEISKRAEEAREKGMTPTVTLPRPMLHSDDCDFSFSGLKTAVLYALKDTKITPELTLELALEFENAVTEVLIKKTTKALGEHGAQTLILGGGVSANTHIRRSFEQHIQETLPHVALYLPDKKLTTDNAVMIAIAGHYNTQTQQSLPEEVIVADGNRRL